MTPEEQKQHLEQMRAYAAAVRRRIQESQGKIVCAGCGAVALGDLTRHVDGCGRHGLLVDGHVHREPEHLERIGVAPAPASSSSTPEGG